METPKMVVCQFCGDRIGVYEPLVALERGSSRETSIAREPQVAEGAGGLMHAGCFAQSSVGFDGGGGEPAGRAA